MVARQVSAADCPSAKSGRRSACPTIFFVLPLQCFLCCPAPGQPERLRGRDGIVGQALRLPRGHGQSQGVQPRRSSYTQNFLIRVRRQALLLSESPFRRIAQETQRGPESVLSQAAAE